MYQMISHVTECFLIHNPTNNLVEFISSTLMEGSKNWKQALYFLADISARQIEDTAHELIKICPSQLSLSMKIPEEKQKHLLKWYSIKHIEP